MNKALLIIAFLGSVAAVSLFYFRQSDLPAKNISSIVERRQSSNDFLRALPENIKSTEIQVDPNDPKRGALAAEDYQSSKDLHSLFLRFRDSKNPSEVFIAWKAIDFCQRYILRSQKNAVSMEPEPLPHATDDQQFVNQKLFGYCSGFREFSPKEYDSERKRFKDLALTSGSPLAAPMLASKLMVQEKIEEAKTTLRNALLSGEPEAITQASYIMPELWDKVSKSGDTPISERKPDINALALSLAACDFGKTCSSSALEIQMLCVYGGNCGDSYEERIFKLLKPEEIIALKQRREVFIRSIKEKNLSALGL